MEKEIVRSLYKNLIKKYIHEIKLLLIYPYLAKDFEKTYGILNLYIIPSIIIYFFRFFLND